MGDTELLKDPNRFWILNLVFPTPVSDTYRTMTDSVGKERTGIRYERGIYDTMPKESLQEYGD